VPVVVRESAAAPVPVVVVFPLPPQLTNTVVIAANIKAIKDLA
jgi:hypothetical protein